MTIDLLGTVASVLKVPADSLDEHANLIESGMDSIAMMRVAGRLRRAGAKVSFADLAERPAVAAWRELLGEKATPVERVEVDEFAPFDLDPLQHAMWIGREEGVAAHFYAEFEVENVDPSRLESAVRAVIARHGMTRVSVDANGQQRILPESTWPGLRVHDTNVRAELSERITDGEVFDVQLSRVDDVRSRVHVNLEMVAADAMSLRILVNDIARAYHGESLPALDYSYPRYLADRAAARDVEQDKRWWLDRLGELPGAPALPVVPSKDLRFTRRQFWLDPVAARQLRERSHGLGLTPAVVLAAAFAEIVGAWSSEPNFLLNIPVFGREPLHDDVDSLVGAFSSSVLLGVRTGSPFVEGCRRIQQDLREASSHSGFTGVEVLRELTRANGSHVVAPVVFASTLDFGELNGLGRPVWMISQGPQVWLDAQVTELDGGILLSWDARESFFAEGVLDAMFDAFTSLVTDLPWDEPVAPVVPIRSWTRGEEPGKPLHLRFFEVAEAEPERVALVWGEAGQMSYGDLSLKARRVSTMLMSQGAQPGDAVGITLPKGPDQVIAVLGVLAAGAYYIPSGVDIPAARRAQAHAVVKVVLTEAVMADAIDHRPLDAVVPVSGEDLMYVIFTSGSTGVPKGVEVPHRAVANTVESVNDHFGITRDDRTIALSALDFDLSAYDLFAFLAFGGSVVLLNEEQRRDAHAWSDLMRRWEVSVVSCVPALLDMLIVTGDLGDHLRLVMLGGDWVTVDLPGRLRELRPGCRFAGLGGMTEAAIHATVFEVDEVDPKWTSMPYGKPLRNMRCRIVDAHGRDCPDWVAGELWVSGAGVALGYQNDPVRTAEKFVEFDGVRWYRTGDQGRYWPDGTVEFLGRTDHQVKIRGHRIELGEIESALTAFPGVGQAVAVVTDERRLAAAITMAPDRDLIASFVAYLLEMAPDTDAVEVTQWLVGRDPAPWITARWQGGPFAHSLAERTDELVAILHGDGDLAEFDRLGDVDLEALQASLVERLPSVMVPDRVAVLPSLPLTANGKIDRAALKRDLSIKDVEEFTPPTGRVEEAVAATWSDLLGTPVRGREQNFFLLGGDSLLATRLVSRLNAAGLGNVGLAALFANPTLAAFAATLAESASSVAQVVADPANRFEPFPPTDVQRAYWIGRGEDFTLGGVGSHFYREYSVPDLDVARLEAAVHALVARHDMLRVVFDEHGQQRVLPEVPAYEVSIVDDLRAEMSHKVFDPSVWPLFSVTVSRDGVLGIGTDNLIFDALSVLIFYSELGALYADPSAELPPVDMSFRDYVLTATPPAEKAQEYWSARLPELPPAPQLPLAVDPAEVKRPQFVRRESVLGLEKWSAITDRARSHGVTPSAVLMSAFADVLGRWSGRADLTLNVTLFDRREAHPDIANVIGDFTSLILVDHHPEPGEAWSTGTRRLQERLWGALDHREASAVWVLRELAKRAGEPDVVMPVVFTSALGLPFPENPLLTDQLWGISQTPQVWLDHQVSEVDGGIALLWDAVEELFPAGLLDAMFDAYLRMLDWLAESDWSAPTPDLLPGGQKTILANVNATAGPRPDVLLHQEFFRIAEESPSLPALLWGSDGSLSYGELADRARRVASVLLAEGVRPGETVAVTLPKGVDQIVAVLGVLAAGAAYVPIGVNQPPVRRERILRLARVRLVVDREFLGAAESADPAPVVLGEDRLAYVIFTSGSTGEPKGVEITHFAAMNTIADINSRFEITASDRVLAVSALDFDLSVYDVFGLLSVGGAVVLVEEEARRDARRWAELVHRHGVTVWNTVPALLDMLLIVAEQVPFRVVLVSGDWVGLDLPGKVDCRFVALGGATEASIWSNCFEVDAVDPEWSSIPYGFPLRNQQFRVVDPFGRDCPVWTPGELWIGGAGVALGYRGAPEATAAQFVDGWYRTGDLGRYWPDGTLEFLGRRDHQVKIRGHRIELGEIEAALHSHPAVGQAVVSPTLTAAIVPARLPRTLVTTGVTEAVDFTGQAAAVAPLLRDLLPAASPPLRDLWTRWLDRQPPAPGGQDEVVDHIWRRIDWFRGVLETGNVSEILTDPVLAPANAGAESVPVIAREIAELAAELGRPVEVVELGGREGVAAERLQSALNSDQVCYTLIDPSTSMVQAAARRLDGVDCQRVAEGRVPESLRHKFDVVLAHNVLHRYADVRHGIAVAGLLVRRGGWVIAVEPTELAPIGLLTAALLENGFDGLDAERRANGSPMLSAQRWAELFAEAGFTEVTHRAVGDSGLATLRARRPEDAVDLDVVEVQRHVSSRLPAHMIPERIEVLPWLPLSANGKVDRSALASPAEETTGDAPRGEVETELAAMWSELLGIGDIGRDQSFFTLGGDSLLATRFIQEAEQRFGVALPLRQLFAAPTIACAAVAFEVEEGEL
ncbi:amino acid adenylation domain-containing protein [Allokutzneria sp. A3M-2-11 16]|uniref:non-ribosomal peptide synthetase n=1 Tax=Allokutzneria sp. A3M-2-11 16 TaxID=2962043 RepID=UPI0020B8C8DB|nr:non-ribosomal peptide synthetase [Allokutzneria sp. A3M-2-11 16]MCP3801290.1 amino acid adenylation domain-containing protein [Allokutzneria sp. A3M-2-11 16]